MASPEDALSYRNLVLETFQATGLPVERTFIGGSGALALWGELDRPPNDLDICVDPLYFSSDALRRTTRIPNTRPQRVETTFWTPSTAIELRPKKQTMFLGLISKPSGSPNAPLENIRPLPDGLLDLDIHTTAPDPEHIMNLGMEPADLTGIAHRKFMDERNEASTSWVAVWQNNKPGESLQGLRVMLPAAVLAGKQQRELLSGAGNILTREGRAKRKQDRRDRNPVR
ncbi:hypothetical protein EYC59_05840 [Candidatus Saccharibacteria bacterium]|nr:MAG: hypothetical protein EYC59_05840 [Candidatus Saccharibacteria bacterium]